MILLADYHVHNCTFKLGEINNSIVQVWNFHMAESPVSAPNITSFNLELKVLYFLVISQTFL